MLPKLKFLDDKVILYNNQALIGDISGRLLAEIEIFPVPRLIWEFEIMGESSKNQVDYVSEWYTKPAVGCQFRIDKPLILSSQRDFDTPSNKLSGITETAHIGSLDTPVDIVTFYLPNCRFQAQNIFGQNRVRSVLLTESGDEISSSPGAVFVDVDIQPSCKIRLETRQAAIDWLDQKQRNIGIRVTTWGSFLIEKAESDTKVSLLTLNQARAILEPLCLLLSFINGGYIEPVLICGIKVSAEPGDRHHAIITSARTSPLEILGNTWFTYDSDLPSYLGCFGSFKQMLESPIWRQAFPTILAWYFQAIQPQDIQTPLKDWPIIANSLGAALEHISYTILVTEETNLTLKDKNQTLFQSGNAVNKYWDLKSENLSRTAKRLHILLQRIGVCPSIALCTEVDDIRDFIDLRNEATHPRKGTVDLKKTYYLLGKAVQWLHEAILWRIGYKGKYQVESSINSIAPRYDLTLRNPTW